MVFLSVTPSKDKEMKKFVAYFLSTLFVWGFATGSANAALVFGDGTAQLEYAEQYANSVLSFQVQDESGNWKPFGSGVVIDKTADGKVSFLAADHSIIKNSGDPTSRFNAYRVGVGNYFTGETRPVAEFILHPNAIGKINGYSYGIGFVDDPFLTANLEPVQFYNGTVMVGQDSDIAGYGVLQKEGSSDFVFTGDLRAGNNVISDVGYLHQNYVATRLSSSSRPNYRPLGMGGTEFDSGGALFIDGSFAALTTFGAGGPFSGSYTGYNLVDRELVMTAVVNRQSTSVPEPSSLLLFSFGSIFGTFMRGRRCRSNYKLRYYPEN